MAMQEETREAYVVVVVPKRRPPEQRSFSIETHECCALHLDGYSVFVVPKDYGVPGADEDAKQQARLLPESQAIDSMKSLWGGTSPLGIFRIPEAVVVARELLNRSYVILAKDIEDAAPKVAYLTDLVEWRSLKRALDRRSINKPRYLDGYRDHYLCRALRLQILGKGRGVRVETRVIDLAEKAEFKPVLCRVGSWQRRLWEATAGRIPDDEFGCVMPHPEEQLGQKDYRQLDAGIDDKARENLYMLMMSSYWADRKEANKNRSRDFAEQFGRSQPQDRGNMQNVLGRLGCVNPSPSLLPAIYKDLRAAAMGKTASMALHKDLSWESVVHDHELALRLLSVCLPVKIGEIMWGDQ